MDIFINILMFSSMIVCFLFLNALLYVNLIPDRKRWAVKLASTDRGWVWAIFTIITLFGWVVLAVLMFVGYGDIQWVITKPVVWKLVEWKYCLL